MTTPQAADWDAICRRAGGRRRYNHVRRIRAEFRLIRVVRLLDELGGHHGYQTRIAEHLGVSRSTICRDLARLCRRFRGGHKAEEEHRSEVRMQQRVRAKNKQERERVAAEQSPPGPESESPPCETTQSFDHVPPSKPPEQLPK